MNYTKCAIILCGGNGSRLWPLSTSIKPKQFLTMDGKSTLIENTIKRIPNDYLKLFISNVKYKNEIMKYVKHDDIILFEPCARNTGQSINIGVIYLKKHFNKNLQIIVLPCDHLFDDIKFNEMLNIGMNIVDINNIVTFGIKPTYPEPGYGYIMRKNLNEIDYFIEKPSFDKAVELINNGCLWNSGIFMFELDYLEQLFNIYNSKDINILKNSLGELIGNEVIINHDYQNVKNISFDVMIMENIKTGNVIEYDGLWTDIGDWKRFDESIHNVNENNTLIGTDIKPYMTNNCLIYSDSGEIITVGLNDLIIVKFNENLLIMHKDKNNDFKDIIKKNNLF